MISYEDLYQRWEQNNWSAYAIDFSRDRKGWTASPTSSGNRPWIYSMFFFGEDSVADNLSPYIDAAPKEGRSTSSRRSRLTRRATPSSSTASSRR